MAIRSLVSFGMVLVVFLAAGCGSEPEAVPSNQKYRDGGSSGIQGDAMALSSNPWNQIANPEAGAPVGGSDAKVPPVTNCQGPTGATCASACAADSICTAGKGGTCAKTVALKGAADSKEVLAALASAYVTCWNKAPSSYGHTLCYTFDTCQMTGTYDHQNSTLHDWVCNKSAASDFPSKADYDTAKSIFACSWSGWPRDCAFVKVESGTNGKICMWYNNKQLDLDSVEIDDCAKL